MPAGTTWRPRAASCWARSRWVSWSCIATRRAWPGRPPTVRARVRWRGLDDAYTRLLLQALDGHRDRAALLAYLQAHAADEDAGGMLDADALDATLQGFARLGLLDVETGTTAAPADQRTM